ncbi:unnamed protein product [Malus baccata var. baccata]
METKWTEKMEISLDKLPIKRLEVIEENGLEHDVGYDEKRKSLIRRIDFAWAVEKDENKKQKKSSKESAATQWQWQSIGGELAAGSPGALRHYRSHQHRKSFNSRVEANDAVTVASMTRPKPLPNEALSDLAVSAATKLQCFRHLGKYFKQSAKALDRQVAREARFYGALIRLQQNWKVKRQHMAASASGNEGFTIDLFDNSVYDPAAIFRPSALSTVHDEHDSAGRLAINVPPNSFRSLQFGFLSADPADNPSESSKTKINSSREAEKESVSDDESVKDTHSLLREVHQAIFDEQVYFTREGTSVFISLIPSKDEQTADSPSTQNIENAILPLDTLDDLQFPEDDKPDTPKKMSVIPDQISSAKNVPTSTRVSGQPAKEGSGLLGHFCMSLAHQIFSNKVLTELENLVKGVPYLQLLSQPTWHSWTSSWMLSVKIPQSLLHACQPRASDMRHVGNVAKFQFHTKVVVTDDCINVEGEGAPNMVGLFNGNSEEICSMNRYNCNLADLPVIILQQVAGQVIHRLHEEALAVGIKANRDFLCSSLELDQGETLSVVAHVDPEDSGGCISWWLVIDDTSDAASETRKFLGHLSLEVLYSTLMYLVSLCNGGGN